jgi:hypothetical protein
MNSARSESFYRLGHLVITTACLLTLYTAFPQKAHATSFTYAPIEEPILSAVFSADFAALTAHRTVFGFEVNTVALVSPSNMELNLSNSLFGTTDALLDPATIDQGPLGTGIVTAAIDPLFFPGLASGSVGLVATFTDTFDGLFAIDFLSLTITTATGTTVALIDSNNGFGIGIPDAGMLPSPLPISISIDATGTGFDEAISSISFAPVPAPATIFVLASGLGLLVLTGRLTKTNAKVHGTPCGR